MRKISVTEGLCELKLYDAKIRKSISNSVFCGASKKSSDKVGFFKKSDFPDLVKASYQSDIDLIKNRNMLKSAIVQSNAITNVQIGNKVMTRAEAIERKKSIEYDELLLLAMKEQYAQSTSTVDKENRKVDGNIEVLLNSFVGKESDKKISDGDLAAIERPYREKNEWDFIDPINLLNKIQELESDIDEFKSNVDTVLTLSNAVSFIEIDF